MSVYVSVRARLKGEPQDIQPLHDQVTAATKAMAQAAGDVGHTIYLSAHDPRDFLGLDQWQSAEAFQQFASDPQAQQFFSQLFEGQPQVTMWSETDWSQW